jgi:hypothetical protein
MPPTPRRPACIVHALTQAVSGRGARTSGLGVSFVPCPTACLPPVSGQHTPGSFQSGAAWSCVKNVVITHHQRIDLY